MLTKHVFAKIFSWEVSVMLPEILKLEKKTIALQAKKKNTLVSGNAVEKNLHPGGSLIFLNQFNWIFWIKFKLKELL